MIDYACKIKGKNGEHFTKKGPHKDAGRFVLKNIVI